MKNNFLSKAVPLGTRTIWRYLSALILLFSLAIGNVWADLTAHVPGVYEKTVATGGYGCTLTTVASGENAGTFEVYYFSAQSKYSENTTVYNGGTKQQYRLMCTDSDSEYQLINRNGTGTFTASCDWIEMAYGVTGFSKSDYTYGSNKFNEFFEITPNGGNTGITKTCYLKPKEGDVLTLKVSGYVEFAILGNDNGSSKYMTISVDGGTPTSWKSNTLSRRAVSLTTGEHTIVVACVGNSANAFYGFSLKLPSCEKPDAPTALSCTAQTVNSLTFGWTKETNAVGYVAKLYSDSGCETEVDSKDLGDVNTVTFTGLSNSSTYYCKVQSKGNGTDYCEEGSVTSAADGTTKTPSCGDVTAPTSLLVGATTADGASFTIIDDADAFNYEFYVSESSTEPESSTTATHTSTEKTKDVTGLTSGKTYYAWVRSVCDVDHKSAWTAANKSFKVRTTPTASFADATYIIGASAIDVSANFTSNSEAAVVYELKESYPNVTLSGSSFSATAAGEYVVVANQAGNADYTPISKEATITVLDSELSDIYIWQKNADHGGDGKCVTSAQANQNVNANQASTTLDYSTLVMDGMSAMGRPASPSTVTLTFSVKDAYKSSFGITNVCVYGKIEEAGGLEYSWNNVDWTAVAGGESGNNKHEFTAPAGTYAENFYIRFTNAEAGKGGLWFRNALVTLEVKKTVTGVTEALVGAEIDGAAISSAELTTLLADKTLDIATAYAAAPTVTFKKQVTTSYAGGWPADVEDVDVEVTASDITTAWQASATINAQEYTITIAKPTVPSLVTEATGFTLTSAKVATDTKNFNFSGVNLTAGNVTIALESPVAGMTVSPTEVTPTAGVITDQEVTITYKSLEDVAEANVNLVVYYDTDTKIVLPLTYSSTAGVEDLTPISAATTWNWDHANSSTEEIESLDANNIVVFANYSGWVESFKANSLAGRLQYVYRGNNYAQGHNLKFNTTVPGIVTVSFSNTGNKSVARAPRITDTNGSYAPTDEADGAKTADAKSYSHAVAAGDVLIEGFEMQEGTPANMLRFYEVRFVRTYSVTYMPNGGTGAEYIIDDNAAEVRAGSIFTAPASSAFVEWNTQADGNGDTYLPGAAVTADLMLFAQWETSYEVTFNMQDHGTQVDPQNIVSGGKVVKPADPSESGWDFGGWYKESACTNAWDFDNGVVTEATELFAKWTADPCPTPFSLSKVVLTSASDGTVTGYNNDEYAGEKVIGGLSGTQTAEVDPSHEGTETGYKLNNGGSAMVFATLKKGTFQVGDRVVVTITKAQDAYKVEEVAQPILDIYYGTDKNDATFLTTIENVTAAGTYTYRLTAADVTAIGNKKGIGVFRPSSGRTQNPYVYSVEIKGCREWAIFHTLTFKNIDGTATIAAEPLEEGAAASTVAPVAPKIAMKRFLGWAEAIDGTLVELTAYTITEDKTLYAVYEDIVCPTTGTVYKFQLKTDLTNGNIFTSAPGELTLNTTDHLSSMVNGEVTVNLASGKNTNRVQFYDGKAIGFANGDGASITLTLDCALATGDEIRFINYAGNGNKMNLSDGTHSLELNGNSAETVQKITVNSDWNGADELTLTRGGNTPKLTYFEIYRPAKFDVSFNMMGHGTQIADIEDVIDGSKISAPTAPTDANYSFSAWYKENELENEWDFDNDVVVANTTLFAKWLDKSDATLKSLKYGDTEIALEDGVYTYEVNVPGFLTAVPALTAVTSNPSAIAAVTDAAEFDGEGKATSTVEVTPEKEGAAHQTYTVKFTKLPLYTDIVDVTGYTEWSWAGVATAEVKINDVANRGVILANYIDAPNFEMLAGQENARAYRNNTYPAYQGTYLKFHATVPGRLTINARNSSGSPILRVNGIDLATLNGTRTNYVTAVPAGDVEITSSADEIRIYAMTFDPAVDYTRDVTEGKYGTICLPTNGVMIGTTIYTLAFYGATSQKIFFDEVVTGRMEAGKPYLFLPEQGVTELKVFYTDSETKAAQAVNGFHGYIGDSEDPEDALQVEAGVGNYIVQNNTYREVQAGATAYILSHRAYIKFSEITPTEPAKAPGARRIGLGKDAAQGFENLQSGDQPMKVMIDGTLYIIRGEKVYNANGQVVK